jgi:hypothetical protein
VIAGRQVRARGTDLDPLRLAVGRAVDLSTGLTQALTRAVPPAASLQRRSASISARESKSLARPSVSSTERKPPP